MASRPALVILGDQAGRDAVDADAVLGPASPSVRVSPTAPVFEAL